ncbi:hypothetical protein C8J57DRAFT_1210534 [Mycena rebaudengoi]|nr:hypothetical protein C8J57DRAFT_1210534 [Mycena rebaudengoi]
MCSNPLRRRKQRNLANQISTLVLVSRIKVVLSTRSLGSGSRDGDNKRPVQTLHEWDCSHINLVLESNAQLEGKTDTAGKICIQFVALDHKPSSIPYIRCMNEVIATPVSPALHGKDNKCVIEAEEPSENSRSRIAYGGGGRIRSRDGEIKGRKGVWVVAGEKGKSNRNGDGVNNTRLDLGWCNRKERGQLTIQKTGAGVDMYEMVEAM